MEDEIKFKIIEYPLDPPVVEFMLNGRPSKWNEENLRHAISNYESCGFPNDMFANLYRHALAFLLENKKG